jgi:predicted nucleic-acid-binding Zn-ribbon protein
MFHIPFRCGYVEIYKNSELSQFVPKTDDFESSDRYVHVFIRDFPVVVGNYRKTHPEKWKFIVKHCRNCLDTGDYNFDANERRILFE